MMTSILLLSMPGPLMGTVMLLTAVIVIYSVAKAIMRFLDKNK